MSIVKDKNQKLATTGYFYGLNGQPPEKAYEHFTEECIYPYESAQAAAEGAEHDRSEGDFFDDEATVQIYKFELKISTNQTADK